MYWKKTRFPKNFQIARDCAKNWFSYAENWFSRATLRDLALGFG